jgi:hypothetical protein
LPLMLTPTFTQLAGALTLSDREPRPGCWRARLLMACLRFRSRLVDGIDRAPTIPKLSAGLVAIGDTDGVTSTADVVLPVVPLKSTRADHGSFITRLTSRSGSPPRRRWRAPSPVRASCATPRAVRPAARTPTSRSRDSSPSSLKIFCVAIDEHLGRSPAAQARAPRANGLTILTTMPSRSATATRQLLDGHRSGRLESHPQARSVTSMRMRGNVTPRSNDYVVDERNVNGNVTKPLLDRDTLYSDTRA